MSARIRYGALVALTLALFAAFPAMAQEKMAEGTWTGMVIPPEDDMVDLEYLIVYGEEGLEIELVLPPEMGMGNLMAGEVTHDGESLTFTLEVGETVSCSLMREDDGHFEGECFDSSGIGALMTMFPPDGSGR